jgi:hypothetical protein
MRVCVLCALQEKNENAEEIHCKHRQVTFTTTKFHLHLKNCIVCLVVKFA